MEDSQDFCRLINGQPILFLRFNEIQWRRQHSLTQPPQEKTDLQGYHNSN